MLNSVIIKSYTNGLKLILDKDIEIEELLEDIANKFNESRKFFGNANIAVAIEGRELSMKEEKSLVDTICKNSDLSISCIVGKTGNSLDRYFKKLDLIEDNKEQNAIIHYGSLKNTQELESDKTIILFGDVYEGCSIKSKGNIIVLGGIYGYAHAGIEGNTEAYIYAHDFSPSKLIIADIENSSVKKNSGWGLKNKMEQKIAMIEENVITIKQITRINKDDIFEILEKL